MNTSVFPPFVGRKEKGGREFAMHIQRDEFHPEWQIRMGLPSLIVITIFLILIREIHLGTMENVLPMFDCCTINHPFNESH